MIYILHGEIYVTTSTLCRREGVLLSVPLCIQECFMGTSGFDVMEINRIDGGSSKAGPPGFVYWSKTLWLFMQAENTDRTFFFTMFW